MYPDSEDRKENSHRNWADYLQQVTEAIDEMPNFSKHTPNSHREEKFTINKNLTIFNEGDEVFLTTHPLSYAGYGLAKKFMPKDENPDISSIIKLAEILI